MSDSVDPESPGEDSLPKLTLTVSDADQGTRLDQFIAQHADADLTRNKVQRLISAGLVQVNSETGNKKYKVCAGDKVVIAVQPPEVSELVPENIPLDIVYEDEHLAVVNKPAGMVTHPGVGNFTGTLVNGLLFHFNSLSTIGEGDRPGIVHRLDKDTSGLLLVARNDQSHLQLQGAIRLRMVKRTYLALVCGHLKEETGTIDLPIGRSRQDRRKMRVNGLEAREAVTEYQVKDRYRTYDLLEVNLQTGRTHQIRVHLSHLGHPTFGDPTYGGRESWHKGIFGPERPLGNKLLSIFDRQALHAYRLEFPHPVSREVISLEASIPADFQAVLDLLDNEGR
ncbi:MAG: RluA family pseudouridine synthase [bacterium]|nr:RluA family pseudouridine synthase [bacterium]